MSRAFWCALGNLYAAARTEVMRLGHAAALRPDASESPMLQNVSRPQDDKTPTWKHAPAVDLQHAPLLQQIYWHMKSMILPLLPITAVSRDFCDTAGCLTTWRTTEDT